MTINYRRNDRHFILENVYFIIIIAEDSDIMFDKSKQT